jgi:zinc and cadmium transporter
MNEWVYSLASAGAVSLISLIGVLTLMVGIKRLDRVIPLLISLAVGGLFGDAMIHILPESFDGDHSHALTSLYVLTGIMIFFLLERYLHWHHEHHERSVNPIHPVAYVNIISDGLHNLLDGLVIGASYLVSVPLGVTTTIAVALHEIPQEQGDFGILIHAGFSPKKALLTNFLSAILALVGVVISLSIGPNLGGYTAIMLPLTAGGFIYIAGSDLIPELHHEKETAASLAQSGMVLLGIGLMFLLLLIE